MRNNALTTDGIFAHILLIYDGRGSLFNGSRVITYQQPSALLGFNRDRFGRGRRA